MRLTVFLLLSQTGSAFVNHAQTSKNQLHSNTRLCDALEPLAEEGTWQAFLDEETTGLIYYFDTTSGESLWEPPTSTFPEVRLPRKKQRLADDLRRKYRKSRQEEIEAEEVFVEETTQEEPNWISGLFDDVKTAASATEQVEAEEVFEEEVATPGSAWFSNMFGGNNAAVEEEEVEVEEEELQTGETVLWKQPRSLFGGMKQGQSATTETAAAVVEEVVEEVVEVEPMPLKIEMGSFVLPHPAKQRWGGEDAVFTKGRTFGVFDGVSGADKLDGVPLYSKTLAKELKKSCGTEGMTVAEMTKSLQEAADYADKSATGASTAVIASIGENGFLQALNVGDSLCMVVREGRIAAKTREISHYWECPYQLSDDSPDRAKDGTKLNVELIPGDVVLMGSDGIFDNVDDDMLLDLVGKGPKKPTPLAKKICDLSRKQSLDRKSSTPYAKQAQRRGDPDYKDGVGGKLDDSSCVVVLVK